MSFRSLLRVSTWRTWRKAWPEPRSIGLSNVDVRFKCLGDILYGVGHFHTVCDGKNSLIDEVLECIMADDKLRNFVMGK